MPFDQQPIPIHVFDAENLKAPVPQAGSFSLATTGGQEYAAGVTQDIRGFLRRSGKSFRGTHNGATTTATNANLYVGALSLFNPAGSGVTCVIHDLMITDGSPGGTVSYLWLTTTDPTYTDTFLSYDISAGGNTPKANLTSSAAGVTASIATPPSTGVIYSMFVPTATTPYHWANGQTEIVRPAGTGLVIGLFVSAVGAYFRCDVEWSEL